MTTPQNQEVDSTRLESADEIHKALATRKKRQQATGAGPIPLAGSALSEPQRERPLQRPPMALLCILDDGTQEGEFVRLRADRTLLGRVEGDIRIPHDVQMSTQHAEILRERTSQGWRWSLRDLGSRNGTFVRVGSSLLRNYNELIMGQGRYRFEAAMAHMGVDDSLELNLGTLLPQPAPKAVAGPALVELCPSPGSGWVPRQRFPLSGSEQWIGRDPALASIPRPDDPFLDPQHARFYRNSSGQWHVANNNSVNGLWLRIKMIPLEKPCQFRLGEQRFFFRVCEP